MSLPNRAESGDLAGSVSLRQHGAASVPGVDNDAKILGKWAFPLLRFLQSVETYLHLERLVLDGIPPPPTMNRSDVIKLGLQFRP